MMMGEPEVDGVFNASGSGGTDFGQASCKSGHLMRCSSLYRYITLGKISVYWTGVQLQNAGIARWKKCWDSRRHDTIISGRCWTNTGSFFKFLYGTGLRLMEVCWWLRVKDVDFRNANEIIVHGGGGDKDCDHAARIIEERTGGAIAAGEPAASAGFGGGLGNGGLAGCLEAEISECRAGIDLAMVLAGFNDRAGSCGRPAQALSFARDEHPAGDAGGGAIVPTDQTGDVSHAAAFFRDTSAGEWL